MTYNVSDAIAKSLRRREIETNIDLHVQARLGFNNVPLEHQQQNWHYVRVGHKANPRTGVLLEDYLDYGYRLADRGVYSSQFPTEGDASVIVCGPPEVYVNFKAVKDFAYAKALRGIQAARQSETEARLRDFLPKGSHVQVSIEGGSADNLADADKELEAIKRSTQSSKK